MLLFTDALASETVRSAAAAGVDTEGASDVLLDNERGELPNSEVIPKRAATAAAVGLSSKGDVEVAGTDVWDGIGVGTGRGKLGVPSATLTGMMEVFVVPV